MQNGPSTPSTPSTLGLNHVIHELCTYCQGQIQFDAGKHEAACARCGVMNTRPPLTSVGRPHLDVGVGTPHMSMRAPESTMRTPSMETAMKPSPTGPAPMARDRRRKGWRKS